jgi:serine/threonine-protein kinase
MIIRPTPSCGRRDRDLGSKLELGLFGRVALGIGENLIVLARSAKLGPYEVLAPLGTGGMGVVYRARDTRLEREVAVKVLPDVFAQDPNQRARFEREAKAVAALSHPNILAIHDLGTHEGVMYAVMELLEGETLRCPLTRGPMPWREVVEVGVAIADGLAAAHAKGIVHRDIKPENLFLIVDGRVKILDFGLARIDPAAITADETGPYEPAATNPGTVMGTVGYMSPEQVRGQRAEAPSDLFSLGCVLYESATGRRAFHRETAVETMTAILHDEPLAPTTLGPETPPELWRIIQRCLAKSPSQRFPSARDLAVALRAIASDPGIPSSVPPAMSPGAPSGIEAMAVLPFENLSGDPQGEYLCDALAEQLIISLTQVRRRDFKVRPFTSVLKYKRQPVDVPTIGHELRVRAVATGTLRQQGEDIWVSVNLVEAQEDDQLWGKRYQVKLGGILELQDVMARDIAAHLRLRLTGEEERRLTRRYTDDPEAYLAFREAIGHWNKFTLDGLKTAIVCCKRALQHDENYGLAYVGLAQCYVLLGNLYLGPRETFAEARRCAERALQIDDSLNGAHTFLGAVYLFHDWNWPLAEQELRRGAGSDAQTSNLTLLGFCLAARGHLQEALDTLKCGQELDPRRAAHRNELAMAYNWLRRHDLATIEAQKAFDLDSTFSFAYAELGIAYVLQGKPDDAITWLEQAVALGHRHPSVQGTLGYAYASAGKQAESLRVVQALTAIAPGRFGFALPIARAFAALGEADQAIAWLRKACDERDPFVIWLNVDHTFDCLRPDPRFTQILGEMGLPS